MNGCISCIAVCLMLANAVAQSAHAAFQVVSMPIGQYVQGGPVHDADDPVASFPVIDVFAPAGVVLYRANSMEDAIRFIKVHKRHPQPTNDSRETLTSFATRYPSLKFDVSRFTSSYTILYVSAPECHACEVQQVDLQHADKRIVAAGINELVLTLQP